MMKRWNLLFCCSVFVAACGGRAPETAAPPVPQAMTAPAPAGSAEPNLVAGKNGLYLTWLEHGDSSQALRFAVWRQGRWSEPRTIAAGDAFFANWADFPSLVELGDGSLLAHWLWKTGGEKYAYAVRVSRSADGARWADGMEPHRDGTPTEHGFVSLVPDAASGCTVLWLDGRQYAGKDEGDPSAQTQLMGADLASHGFGPEIVLDPRVCDCCQTSAVRTSRGMLVAYRDRSDDDIRDIYLVRHDGSAWSEPYALAHDNWQIPGCPVNGPALAAAGDAVAAAWFAMHASEPLVQVALSRDGGATFGNPVRVDDGKPLGRVDVAMLPSGDALVIWLEMWGDNEAQIRARRVRKSGDAEAAFVIASTTPKRASGFPHVALYGERLYFAWTEDLEPSQIRLAAFDLPRDWQRP